MGKAHLKLISPTSVNRAVGCEGQATRTCDRGNISPGLRSTASLRLPKGNRHGLRDSTMILERDWVGLNQFWIPKSAGF